MVADVLGRDGFREPWPSCQTVEWGDPQRRRSAPVRAAKMHGAHSFPS